jgi:hypothetical protein
MEFTRAASDVAATNALLNFDIFGGDTAYLAARDRSMLSIVRDSIPPSLRHQFHFHGNVPREEMLRHLGKARLGVVPSHPLRFLESPEAE